MSFLKDERARNLFIRDRNPAIGICLFTRAGAAHRGGKAYGSTANALFSSNCRRTEFSSRRRIAASVPAIVKPANQVARRGNWRASFSSHEPESAVDCRGRIAAAQNPRHPARHWRRDQRSAKGQPGSERPAHACLRKHRAGGRLARRAEGVPAAGARRGFAAERNASPKSRSPPSFKEPATSDLYMPSWTTINWIRW